MIQSGAVRQSENYFAVDRSTASLTPKQFSVGDAQLAGRRSLKQPVRPALLRTKDASMNRFESFYAPVFRREERR